MSNKKNTTTVDLTRQTLVSVCVSPAKVTKLEHSSLWIEQQVLGFDVPVADPK